MEERLDTNAKVGDIVYIRDITLTVHYYEITEITKSLSIRLLSLNSIITQYFTGVDMAEPITQAGINHYGRKIQLVRMNKRTGYRLGENVIFIYDGIPQMNKLIEL